MVSFLEKKPIFLIDHSSSVCECDMKPRIRGKFSVASMKQVKKSKFKHFYDPANSLMLIIKQKLIFFPYRDRIVFYPYYII